MTATRTFAEYQAEKNERQWQDKVKKQKDGMDNAERVKRSTDWKRIGNDKFKSGNFYEARDYYREAIIFVEDLVDARKKERNELLVPLYSNLAQVCIKLGEHQQAEEATGKALNIIELPKNGMQQFRAKVTFRRGVARRGLGKLEESRDDLAEALRLQPNAEDVAGELAAVRKDLAAQAKEAREKMGGFLNRAHDDREAREERQRGQEEKRRLADQKRVDRRAREEQRQQMAGAFDKLSKGKMLYDQREKEMEPIRQKEKEKKQTLELEQNLLNIIDDSKGLPKTEHFDEFVKKKEERAIGQNDELDQKKKILDKKKKEEQWVEDDVWKGQRDDHRKRLEEERQAAGGSQGPKSMWESKQVARWCEQQLRDKLLATFLEGDEIEPDLAAATLGKEGESCRGYVLKALVTDVVKLEGDASVMQLSPYKPPLYYYDYFLKLDWEVAVAHTGERAYRTAEELIQAAADVDDGKAPASVAQHRVLFGTFKIREFCSEDEPEDGNWPLLTKIKKKSEADPELVALSEPLRDKLRDKVSRLLHRFTQDYKKHWRCDPNE